MLKQEFSKKNVLSMVNVICQMQRFKVTKRDILQTIGVRLGLCRWCCYTNRDKKDKLYGKANIMLEKELDVVKLIRSVNQFKLLLSSMLTK
jgi:hypothetical protein